MYVSGFALGLIVLGCLLAGLILGLILAGASLLEQQHEHAEELGRTRKAWHTDTQRLLSRLVAAGLEPPPVRTGCSVSTSYAAAERESYGGTDDGLESSANAPGAADV